MAGRSAGRSGGSVDGQAFDGLSRVHPNAAGIDIGSETHYVSVPEDRDPQSVRRFGCCTGHLEEMAEWLKSCGIETVVMESTGVYWISVYRMLEERGLDVHLVDARHVKSVPGRKTDVWDCSWLRQLHTFGLLRGCFIPPDEIRVVREYWRHRSSLVEACAQQALLMQKSLEQMNLQLHKVLSDVTGVTGQAIIRAIVAGERDAVVLARLKHPLVKSSEETLAQALTGHYSEEHLFTLSQAVATYDFHQEQIRECDERLAECLSRFEDKADGGAGSDEAGGPVGGSREPRSDRQRWRRKNQPHFDLAGELRRIMGVDLTRIDGISAMTAQVIFSEIGGDVRAFPTEKHFTSWLALCPNNRVTGGKVRSRRTRRSKNRVAAALRVSAQSLHRSGSALGAYYRRMRGRLGAPKAITATAHKLARLVYRTLKYGEAYVDVGEARYQAQYEEQQLRRLKRNAAAMGFALVSQSTGEITG